MPRQQLGNSQLQHSKRAISRNNSGAQSRKRAASAKRTTLITNGKIDTRTDEELKNNERTRAGLLAATGYSSIIDALRAEGRGSLQDTGERRIVATNDVRDTQAQLDSMLNSLAMDPSLPPEQRFSFLRFTYDNNPEFQAFVNDLASENDVSVSGVLANATARLQAELNKEPIRTFGLPSVTGRSRSASASRSKYLVDQRDLTNLIPVIRESADEPAYKFPELLELFEPRRLLNGFCDFKAYDTSVDSMKRTDAWVRELVNEALEKQQRNKNEKERLVSLFYNYLHNPNILSDLERKIQIPRSSSVDGFRELSSNVVKPGAPEADASRRARRRSVSIDEANLFRNEIEERVDNVAADLREDVGNVATNVGQVKEALNVTANEIYSRLVNVEQFLEKISPFLNQLNDADVDSLRNDITSLATQTQEAINAFQDLGSVVNENFNHSLDQYNELNDYNEALQRNFDSLRIMVDGINGEIRTHLSRTRSDVSAVNDSFKKN